MPFTYNYDVTAAGNVILHGSDFSGGPGSIPDSVRITVTNVTPFPPGGGYLIAILGEYSDGTYDPDVRTDSAFVTLAFNSGGLPFGTRYFKGGSTHGSPTLPIQLVTQNGKPCTYDGLAIQAVLSVPDPQNYVVEYEVQVTYPDTPYADDPTFLPITAPPVGPAAPSGLQANYFGPTDLAPNYNSLSWVDNASNELGFIVESNWTEDDSGWGVTAIIYTENLEKYIESGIDRTHVYQYRVRAFNDVARSDPSNVARIEPDTDPATYTWTRDPSSVGTGDTLTIDSPDELPDLTNVENIHLQWTDVSSILHDTVVTPDEFITLTTVLLKFAFPDLGAPGGTTVTIIVTIFGGSVTLGTLTVLAENGSGLYVFTPGKTSDTVYVDSTVDDTTKEVAIPNPFFTTGYIGG